MSLISKWKGPVLPSMREMDMPTTPASRGTKDCLSWIRPREPRKNLLHGIFTYLVIERAWSDFYEKKELTASMVHHACTMDNATGHSTKCQNLFSPVITKYENVLQCNFSPWGWSYISCRPPWCSWWGGCILPSGPLVSPECIVSWGTWAKVVTYLGKGTRFWHTGDVHITCILNPSICWHPKDTNK